MPLAKKSNSAAWYSELEALPGTLQSPKDGGASVVDLFINDKQLLVNLGLLERITANCKKTVRLDWSCDRCTPELKPQDSFIVNAKGTANELSAVRFGNIWFILFRGSHDISNWINDFQIGVTDIPRQWVGDATRFENVCSKPRCHRGFLKVWQTLKPELLRKLETKNVRAGESTHKIFFSGHSLGAASCTIAAWEMSALQYNVLGNVNFESPLVFNCAAALIYQTILGDRTLRVTNENDPVVHMPSHVAQYTHVGTELYMHHGNAQVCTFEQVRECRETMNRSKDCYCSSRDRFSYTRPDRHCATKHYLTFNFCQCNDKSWSTRLVVAGVMIVWILLILLTAFLVSHLLLFIFDRGGDRGAVTKHPTPAHAPAPAPAPAPTLAPTPAPAPAPAPTLSLAPESNFMPQLERDAAGF